MRNVSISAVWLCVSWCLTGCGRDPASNHITVDEVVDVGRDLTDRLESAPMADDFRSFFTLSVKSIRTSLDRVELADRAGLGEKWPVRRLSGYALWQALIEDSSLADRGIKIDASDAVDACIRLGPLECDVKGWEHAHAPPPDEYR